MRNKLIPILSALVIGFLGLPAWAQQPPPPPELKPEPTPLGNPTESPPPTIPVAPPSSGSTLIGPGVSNGTVPLVAPVTPVVVGGSSIFTPMLGTADPCCAQHGFWNATGGLYFMQPFFSSNPAFITSKLLPSGNLSNRQQDMGQKISIAPLASVGYTWSSGLGIRARWFEFQGNGSARGSVDATGTVFPPTGSLSPFSGILGPANINASSTLHLSVYDLEFTYLHGNECWSVLYGAGVRYATMNQSYQLDVTAGAASPLPGPNTFNAYHNFGAAGPTFSLETRKQLGNSAFALYGSARGSILFGATSQNASQNFPGTLTGFPVVNGCNTGTLVLPVGEVELGAEWSQTCGRCRLFAQLGVVGQIWWGGGNASQSLYLATGPGNSSSQTNNFGFLGGVFRAGIDF